MKVSSKLVTRGSWLHLKRSLILSPWTKCHFFVWDPDSNLLGLNQNKLHRKVYLLNVVVAFLYFIFVLYKCIQINITADVSQASSPARKIYMVFIVVTYAFCVVLHLLNLSKSDDVVRFTQQYFAFVRNHEGKARIFGAWKTVWRFVIFLIITADHRSCLQGEFPLANTCGYITAFLYYALWNDFVALMSVVILKPSSPEMVSSVLYQTSDDGSHEPQIFLRIFSALFHLIVNVVYLQNCQLYLILMFIFVSSNAEILNSVRYAAIIATYFY